MRGTNEKKKCLDKERIGFIKYDFLDYVDGDHDTKNKHWRSSVEAMNKKISILKRQK